MEATDLIEPFKETLRDLRELEASMIESMAITERLQRELAEMQQDVTELRDEVELEE